MRYAAVDGTQSPVRAAIKAVGSPSGSHCALCHT